MVEFENWLFYELLPTLRRTGTYTFDDGNVPTLMKIFREAANKHKKVKSRLVHVFNRFYLLKINSAPFLQSFLVIQNQFKKGCINQTPICFLYAKQMHAHNIAFRVLFRYLFVKTFWYISYACNAISLSNSKLLRFFVNKTLVLVGFL